MNRPINNDPTQPIQLINEDRTPEQARGDITIRLKVLLELAEQGKLVSLISYAMHEDGLNADFSGQLRDQSDFHTYVRAHGDMLAAVFDNCFGPAPDAPVTPAAPTTNTN